MNGNTNDSEVIIVGAGPAGSTAAWFLAKAGVKVTLLDREDFPRGKICGEALTSHAAIMLEKMGLYEKVMTGKCKAPSVLRLRAPDGLVVENRTDEPPPNGAPTYGVLMGRETFDTLLLQEAVKAGARFVPNFNADSFGRDENGAGRVYVGGRHNGHKGATMRARLVISTDGSQVGFSRKLGFRFAPPTLMAVRAYFETDGEPEVLDIHFEHYVLPGYVWMFPMPDGRVNLGLGTLTDRIRREKLNLNDMVGRFLGENPLAAKRLGSQQPMAAPRGFPLRAGLEAEHAYTDGALVAGDAVGLVYPLNGEGIGFAMQSGEVAAEWAKRALEAGDFSRRFLSGYARALEESFGGAHKSAMRARSVAVRPAACNRILHKAAKDPEVARMVCDVLLAARPASDAFSLRWLARLFF